MDENIQKKILIVSTVPSMIGQFNMDNIKILLKLGYAIDVASNFLDCSVWPLNKIETLKDDLEQMKIRCIHINFSRGILAFHHHIEAYRQLKNLIKNNCYYMVHTHTPIASALVRFVFAKNNINTKVIYTAHGFHFFKGAPLKNWLLFYPLEKFLSRYTDVLITINHEDFYRAEKKFYAKNVKYIPGVGINIEKFSKCDIDRAVKRSELNIKEDDFVLLSVGELSARKNQKLVIDALVEMKKKQGVEGIVYLIVGEGELYDSFLKRIKNEKISNSIRLLGFRTDINELCKISDCFVHTSIREGLGIAPLEAMASGLPLISTNVNGMKDYTEDGKSGCCINPHSMAEMISAVEKMKNDKNFRNSCSINNVKIASLFDIKKTNAIMENIYSENGTK